METAAARGRARLPVAVGEGAGGVGGGVRSGQVAPGAPGLTQRPLSRTLPARESLYCFLFLKLGPVFCFYP